MAHGGARRNAGRPKGLTAEDKVRAARKVMEKHVHNVGVLIPVIPEEIAKMTPLEVMLKAMSILAYEGKWVGAAAMAKEAAPYLHPKLSSINVNANVKRSIHEFSDEELVTLASASEDQEGATVSTTIEGTSSPVH